MSRVAPSRLSLLIRALSQAIKSDRITALAATLASLHETGTLAGPGLYLPPMEERYARNLIWRDPAGRFVVVAMTWGPGQTTPLHDHGRLWGGEIVVSGTMHETTYALADRDSADRCRFLPLRRRSMGPGTVSLINPPLEYHVVGNAGDCVAQTLHVYSGDLSQAAAFSSETDNWYRARDVELRYDG